VADVTNYNIENASGLNVRIDLNSVFAAIQSNNSKSTDLATSQCVAGMTFLNTTSKILKIRNSSNNGFTEIGNIDQPNLGLLSKSGGTMNGVIELDDSNSAATPALSFDGDEDLGLFRKSANVMGFSASGTEQMTFDANGITLNNQNEVRFSEGSSNGTNHITVKAPSSVASNRTLTLPDETGTLITSNSSISSTSVSGVLFALGGTSVSRGNTIRALTGMNQITPQTNNTFDLGSSSLRWRDIFTADLDLSNEGSKNDIDGTWGSYKIQEGEEHLYLINRRNGKKYKFNLTEIE
tara:strand:- start:497 stop:1381 length:885 start_codon:yes stop_codon:yes gene_type:complete